MPRIRDEHGLEAKETDGFADPLRGLIQHFRIPVPVDAEPDKQRHVAEVENLLEPSLHPASSRDEPARKDGLRLGDMKMYLGERAVAFQGTVKDVGLAPVPATRAFRSVDRRSVAMHDTPEFSRERGLRKLGERVEQRHVMTCPPSRHSEKDPALETIDDLQNFRRAVLVDQIVWLLSAQLGVPSLEPQAGLVGLVEVGQA